LGAPKGWAQPGGQVGEGNEKCNNSTIGEGGPHSVRQNALNTSNRASTTIKNNKGNDSGEGGWGEGQSGHLLGIERSKDKPVFKFALSCAVFLRFSKCFCPKRPNRLYSNAQKLDAKRFKHKNVAASAFSKK
jgi:hypothetical protein